MNDKYSFEPVQTVVIDKEGLKIDGVIFKGVTDVKINSPMSNFSSITVTFWGRIEGLDFLPETESESVLNEATAATAAPKICVDVHVPEGLKASEVIEQLNEFRDEFIRSIPLNF